MAAAALCCMTMSMMAEPVSPSVARKAAARFLQGKGAALKSEAMRAPRRAMGRATCDNVQTEASPYYVFNASASKGFVIVSGDDCVGENLVLGYTAQGSFEADNIPNNMQWWLDEMECQISELSRRGAKARMVAPHQDIAPLVTSIWGQGSKTYEATNPYNGFCPETDGELCLSGCVATALSQVMYYYRWPQGQLASEVPAYTMANGRVIEALPAMIFDWNNMIDDYNQPTSLSQQAAVATLMRYCGQSVQMEYSPTGSGALFYDTDLLVNLFGYDLEVHEAFAREYSVSGWDELLYNELCVGRPLVYGGTSTSSGHAFVVDGYQVQDGIGYFHVNWGWGGAENGFFRINLLNPYASGTNGNSTSEGYSLGQTALIGFQPAKSQQQDNYVRHLTSQVWDYSFPGWPPLFYAINTSYRPGTFDIALAKRKDDGSIDYNRLYHESSIEMEGYNYGKHLNGEDDCVCYYSLNEDIAEGLEPGHHELVFVSRESNTDGPWRSIYGPNCYIEVNVDHAGLLTDMSVHPLPQLSASDSQISIDGLMQYGLIHHATATIQNNSDDDYIGGVMCRIYSLDDNDELKAQTYSTGTGLFVEARGSSDVPFNFTAPEAGNYVLVLTVDGKDEDNTGCNLSDIGQVPGYLIHKTFSIDPLDLYWLPVQYREETDYWGNQTSYVDVVVGNNTPMDYDALLMAYLFKLNSDDFYEYIPFPTLYSWIKIKSGGWVATSINLPEALEPGEYAINLLVANDFHSLYFSEYFTFATDFFTVGDAQTVTQIENREWNINDGNAPWFTLDGRKLNSRPITKGIYIYKGKKVMIK